MALNVSRPGRSNGRRRCVGHPGPRGRSKCPNRGYVTGEGAGYIIEAAPEGKSPAGEEVTATQTIGPVCTVCARFYVDNDPNVVVKYPGEFL